MKKYLFFILLILLTTKIIAQENELYSFSFEEASLNEVFDEIEESAQVDFFYDETWLNETEVTATYENKPLDFILNDVLQSTSLNFIILSNRVILTNNNIVYTELPEGFFGVDSIEEQQNSPIFYEEYDLPVSDDETVGSTENLYFIGKERKNASEEHEITGYVRDAATGRPLSYATIVSTNNDINAVSDGNGFYKIILPTGLNKMEVATVGYKTQNVKLMVYSDGVHNFELVENVNMLDEVVLSSTSKRNIRDVVTGVSSINIKEMKNIPMVLGERDVIKVATIMPGVKTTGEGSAGFNVRGGKSDQNLILLDNAVLYNPFHFLGFFSAVNPYLVGSADLYKGSIPAEYGGRLSSVFDIETKKPNLEEFSGEAGIGPVTSNATASIPIIKGEAGLLVGARATYSDWILNVIDEESLKNSEASFYDGLLKYYHELNERNELSATAYVSHDKFSIASDSLYKYNNIILGLEWKHEFNDNHRASVQLNNSQYKFNIDYESADANAFVFDYNINETQLKLKLDYKLNDKHSLTYGVSSKYYKIDPGNKNPLGSSSLIDPIDLQAEQGLESAVFLADAFEISERFSLSAGLRYSVYAALGAATQRVYETGQPLNDATVVETRNYGGGEVIETYGGLEYRFSARYLLSKNFSVKASYDTNRQYVHLLSTNTTQSPTDTWQLSNLNVEPQTSQQYSLGLYKNLKNDIYQISLEGYYKNMNNILDYKVGAELLLNEYLETELLQGEGKAYGIEALVRKTEGKLNGWLGYTYSRAFIKLDSEFNEETVNNGEFFPTNFDKPHDFSLVMNYKLTKRYSFSANFIYQTGRPITYPVGSYEYNNAEYTLYSDRNAFRIPDYYRLDIGINIEGNHKKNKLAHSFWNISIYNVLGRNNPYSVYFVTEEGEIRGYKTSIFSIPVPTITYNFTF